jgi:hypothetical protein
VSILSLYGGTLKLATLRAARAWPVAFSSVLYAILMVVSLRLFGRAGMLGGFVIGAVGAACLSSYLHLLSAAVAGRPIRLRDLQESFGARFWDVISVMFAFWLIDFVLARVAHGTGDQGTIVIALAHLAMAVFFNPTLELLYQSQARSFSVLSESATFISRSGPEWLIPNIAFALLVLFATGSLHGSPPGQIVLNVSALLFPVAGGTGSGAVAALFSNQSWPVMLLLLLLIHWVMVFRGVLFAALNGRVPRGPGFAGFGRR